MRVLALDIWQDLRQKRLWPVALGLIVAIVAIVVLALRAEPSEPILPAGTAGTSAGSTSSDIRLIDEPLGGSSDLGRFKVRDPFAGATDPATDAAGGLGSVPSLPSGGATEPLPSTIPSSGSSTGSVASGSMSGGDAPGASSASHGGSGVPATLPDPPAGGDPNPPPTPPDDGGRRGGRGGDEPSEPNVVLFTHEVDVVFGQSGSLKRHNGLKALDLLPKRNPLLLFSGVSVDGRVAVFSVLHPELEFEGRCLRVHGSCSLLYLREGGERRFTDPAGRAYKLRLASIDRVKLKG